jgi:nitrogen fixation NifU-like protein
MLLDDLYRDVILDHYRTPRNAADLDHVPEARVHENPSCGDSLKLEVRTDAEGKVTSIRHASKGCAISVASTSLMCEHLEGRPVEEARALAETFIRMMRGEEDLSGLEPWGDLAALQGVSRFPVRVKCATLAWHAFLESLS